MKSPIIPHLKGISQVAPGVGAWVEMQYSFISESVYCSSPPVWGRGLKSYLRYAPVPVAASPPVWGRGLKYLQKFRT